MILACACGAPLDDAPGTSWSMAGVVCEYRACLACGSHRAWMPVDSTGYDVELYAEPSTSEVTGWWPTLLDALEHAPPKDEARLYRRGVVLATAKAGEWHVAAPTVERGR